MRHHGVSPIGKSGRTDAIRIDFGAKTAIFEHVADDRANVSCSLPAFDKALRCVPGDRVVAGMIDGDDNEAACGEIGAEPRHLHCAGSGAVRQRNDWIFAEYWSEHGIFGGATGIE